MIAKRFTKIEMVCNYHEDMIGSRTLAEPSQAGIFKNCKTIGKDNCNSMEAYKGHMSEIKIISQVVITRYTIL